MSQDINASMSKQHGSVLPWRLQTFTSRVFDRRQKKLFHFISDFYFIQSDSDGFILFLRSHGASVEWMNEWSDDQQVCLSETDISPLSNSHSLDMMSWFKAMITEHTSYIHLVWSVNKSTDHILSFMMDLPVANRLIWFNSRESNKHKFGFKLTTSVRR